MKGRFWERVNEKGLLFCAFLAVVAIALIGTFVFKEGLPLLAKVGLWEFIGSRDWAPLQGHFGIYAMIVGSFAVTLGALVLGVPLGLATAIFMAEFAPSPVVRVVRPAVELLAGIPSVIYGLFGMTLIVPVVRTLAGGPLGAGLDPQLRTGFSIIAASIVLAIMILPTVMSISEDSLRAVPAEYREGSLALGATHWQTVIRVLLPAARSGIIAGVVLGMGRAIGETMAVIMVAGNTPAVPHSLFAPVRTLTGNIAIEMNYAAGDHTRALFATGIILFALIMVLNMLVVYVTRRGVRQA